jgi:hypothetical protein
MLKQNGHLRNISLKELRMSGAELFQVDHGDDLTVLRIHAPPSGLSFTDAKAMEHLWRILQAVAFRKPKVLLLLTEEGLLSPTKVEQTWREIVQNRPSRSTVPPQVYAARTNLRKLIEYFKKSQSLCIGAVRGEVDFDLLGLFAACHYRICAKGTAFENNVIDRSAPPGSAAVWLLVQLLGKAQACELLLEGSSLSADEARSLKLVNAILPNEGFEADAIALAKNFADKPRNAIRSLVVALNHSSLPIADYLKEVGAGFDKIYTDD